MIRTGYLRWEIEAEDCPCPVDRWSREIHLLARPSYRRVLVQAGGDDEAAQKFVAGRATYDEVLQAVKRGEQQVEITISDVGPHIFRYDKRDQEKKLLFWMSKLDREIDAFATEVVRAASRFPRLVIASPAIRHGYAKLVAIETKRVIERRSQPQPTVEDAAMTLEVENYSQGVPELVAAELVRDVVTDQEFEEFRIHDRVTVRNGEKLYRIPRRPHAFIEVWDAQSHAGLNTLCVVFQDPGMPPSDEVVMKYLLAKHQPEMLWKIGNQFGPPSGPFEPPVHRRWISF